MKRRYDNLVSAGSSIVYLFQLCTISATIYEVATCHSIDLRNPQRPALWFNFKNTLSLKPQCHSTHAQWVEIRVIAHLTSLASGKYQTHSPVFHCVKMKEWTIGPSDTKMKYHDLLQGNVNHPRQRHAGRALAERAVVLSPKPPTESSHWTRGSLFLSFTRLKPAYTVSCVTIDCHASYSLLLMILCTIQYIYYMNFCYKIVTT